MQRHAHLVGKDARYVVHRRFQLRIWNQSQTSKRVRSAGATSIGNNAIVVNLAFRNVSNWNGSPRLHEGSTEEALCITTLSKHVEGCRNRSSGFTPTRRGHQVFDLIIVERAGAHIVTLVGSPPNWVIYFWTHLKASRSNFHYQSRDGKKIV